MRTTIDIDDPILKQVKRLGKAQGNSLGRIVSDLLAQALHTPGSDRREPAPFRWICKGMGARIDLEDKDALYAALEPGKLSDERAADP